MNLPRDDRPWPDTQRLLRPGLDGAPATQLARDSDDYLGQSRDDIGRRIAPDQVELFINGEVAPSLQQELQRHQPEFIALHDVGTSASLRVLAALAGAGGARVQRLAVRRQGQGVALAVLQFVEMPLPMGPPLRVYATDISADGLARTQVAQVLLGYSRLGVLLTGELPPHALTAALMPLREAVSRGPWPNRDLLLVPLGSGTALAAQAAQLAAGGPVQVRVTPRAGKPKTAWGYIAGAWNRLHGASDSLRQVHSEMARAVPRPPVPRTEAATQPMGLDDLPSAGATAPASPAPPRAPVPVAPPAKPAAAPASPSSSSGGLLNLSLDTVRAPAATQAMPVPGGADWAGYVQRCAGIKGAVAACVFDIHTLQPLAHAGNGPGAERLAQQGAQLLTGMAEAARALGLGSGRTEAAISIGAQHLLLRPVPGHPGIALHLVLSADGSNLTLARMQLERIEPPA